MPLILDHSCAVVVYNRSRRDLKKVRLNGNYVLLWAYIEDVGKKSTKPNNIGVKIITFVI